MSTCLTAFNLPIAQPKLYNTNTDPVTMMSNDKDK